MARDENNGELSFLDRFMYASGREAWKEAHRSARINAQAVFWFAEQRMNTSRQWGDSLAMWSFYGAGGRYEDLSSNDIQYRIKTIKDKLGMS